MMIIDIVPVTKQRYRILTDEQPAFVLYKGELASYGLEIDGELPDTVWEEIEQTLIKRAKLRAMHLLTRMDYTEAELYRKLVQGEYTERAAAIAMEYVKSFHYIDDKRYVKNYMSQPCSNKSRRQKTFELERKGISKELIREYLETSGTEHAEQKETSLIRTLLEKRCKNPKTADTKEKMKHYGYLARKGFSSADIMQVFEEFFGYADEEV